MKKLTIAVLSILFAISLSWTAAPVVNVPIGVLKYKRTVDPNDANRTLVTAWLTLLNQDSGQNLLGTFVAISSPAGAVTTTEVDGTYEGKPFWNIGDILSDGAGLAKINFSVPVVQSQPVVFNAEIFRSLSAPVVKLKEKEVSSETENVVLLDGSGSYDPDGNSISYSWTFKRVPEGSTTTLVGANTPVASFAPDVEGDFFVELSVSDGPSTSVDRMKVKVKNGDPAPIANAGPDLLGTVGDTLKFDGRNSHDLKNRQLDYTWSFIYKPAGSALTDADIDDSSVAGMGIFHPDVAGRYVVQMLAEVNGNESEDTAVALVAPVNVNLPPVANAGSRVEAFLGSPVVLDGSLSSDPNGDAISYYWKLTGKPAGSHATLTGGDTAAPIFNPDVKGIYEAKLTVSDGVLDSLSSTVMINVFSQIDGVIEPGVNPLDIVNLAAATTFGQGAATVSSPIANAVYPINLPENLRWNFGGESVKASAVELTYGGNAYRFYVYRTAYKVSDLIWKAIADTHGPSEDSGPASFRLLYELQDGTMLAVGPINFRVSINKTLGQIVFWGISHDDGSSNIYSVPADGTGSPMPIYGTLNGQGCAGCHSVSPQGIMSVVADWNGGQNNHLVDVSNPNNVVDMGPLPDGPWSTITSFDATGTKLLYVGSDTDYQMHVYNMAVNPPTDTVIPMPNGGYALNAVWTPDNKIVAVKGNSPAYPNYWISERTSIVLIDPVAGTEVTLVPADNYVNYYPAVNPNGGWLVFNKSTDQSYSSSTAELWLLEFDNNGPIGSPIQPPTLSRTSPEALQNGWAFDWPTWSPDGTWLAFSKRVNGSSSYGEWDLYKAAFNSLTGEVSEPVEIPGAATGTMGEHIPYWVMPAQ